MLPRRGWGIFGLGFYKDVAPTALGKLISLIHIQIAFPDVDLFDESLKIFHNGLAAIIPRFNMIHFKNHAWVCGWRAACNPASKIVSTHNEKFKPPIDCSGCAVTKYFLFWQRLHLRLCGFRFLNNFFFLQRSFNCLCFTFICPNYKSFKRFSPRPKPI